MFTPLIINIQTYFIDYSTNHTSLIFSILAPTIIVYFSLNLIDFNSNNLIAYFKFKITNKFEQRFVKDYLHRTSKINYEEFENSANQDLIFRVGQTLLPVSGQVINFVPTIMQNAIILISILYFVVISGVWWIFPISIILSLPSFYFNKKRIQFARKVWAKDNVDMRYSDYLHRILVNRESAKERKLFQYTNYLSSKWDSIFKRYNKNKMKDYLKSSVATGLAMFFSMSNIVIYGLFLLSPLQNNVITIGLYVSLLQMITNRFNSSINAIIREVTNLTKVSHFVKDLNDFKSLKYIDIDEENQKKYTFDSIRFDNVYFSYPNTDRYILKGVSFEMKKGMQCSLIGLNGAGKTTITKLMMGLYRPTSGKIFINEVDITEYSYNQLLSFFVCMQQELVNYKMTARENIGLFQMSKNEDNVLLDKALESCNLLDLKGKFNNNYDTNLSPELENGIMLSGGEWQKVAIARSIFAERDFFILDEPTAALDPLAEVEFYQNYKSLMNNRTCLYITHRLGSTYLFDQCFVLNDGVIAESGTHEELMNKTNGLYKELFTQQKEWYVVKESKYEVS